MHPTALLHPSYLPSLMPPKKFWFFILPLFKKIIKCKLKKNPKEFSLRLLPSVFSIQKICLYMFWRSQYSIASWINTKNLRWIRSIPPYNSRHAFSIASREMGSPHFDDQSWCQIPSYPSHAEDSRFRILKEFQNSFWNNGWIYPPEREFSQRVTGCCGAVRVIPWLNSHLRC